MQQGEDWIEYTVDRVHEYYHGRQVVFWGKCLTSENIGIRLKEKYQIDVAFYIDSDIAKVDNKLVMPIDSINGKAQKYYIMVPLATYQSVRECLYRGGYSADRDYFYFSDCAVRDDPDYYEDAHNNRIIGRHKGLKFAFFGFNSKIEIGDNVRFCGGTCFYVHGNAKVTVGNYTELTDCIVHVGNNAVCGISEDVLVANDRKNHWFVDDDAVLQIGTRGNFVQGVLRVGTGACLEIGQDFTTNDNYQICASNDTSIFIGEDCMLSHNIEMRSDDGHSIFDITTGKNINSTPGLRKSRKIVIGKHVWIGMHSIILYNADIADGSVIGAMSLVKGKIPNNCIAAGVPARVIRRDIAWSRQNGIENILECGEEYIHLTKEESETYDLCGKAGLKE